MTRRRMPPERESLTHKFTIRAQEDTFKGYLTVGFFEDGTVGEIFVKMDKQGGTVSGFVDAWAISVSMLLQSGASLESLCTKFRGMSFEPAGATDTPEIHFARSPIDYIARYLELKWVKGEYQESRDVDPRSLREIVDEAGKTIQVCEKCGMSEGVIALRFGRRLCDRCSSGRAA